MRHGEGRNGVGVVSGGRHNVECALRELHALGVRSWAEPVPDHRQDPLDMERFNVFVDPEDRDKADEWWVGGMSPASLEASEADYREHRERVREERANIEVRFEDVGCEDFVQALGNRMTVEQAVRLRQFYVQGPTWRALARWAQDRSRTSGDWVHSRPATKRLVSR